MSVVVTETLPSLAAARFSVRLVVIDFVVVILTALVFAVDVG